MTDLYAAQIVCNCGQRLAIVDVGKAVHTAQCPKCKRSYQVSKDLQAVRIDE